MHVGFIGLGTMGLPMAKNIVKGGYALSVFDTSPERGGLFSGLSRVSLESSIADLAAKSDIVITMLPSPEIITDVIAGAAGVLESMKAGAVWVDMSTSDPFVTRKLVSFADDKGIHCLDAPVARSSKDAEEGTLLVMAGGTRATYDRVLPVLSTMASDVLYCGSHGMGHSMKLVNNHLNMIILQVSIEALVLGAKSGLTLETMMNVFKRTAAWNLHLQNTLPWKAFQGDFTPGFKLSLAEKDLGLVKSMARQVNMPVMFGSLSRELMSMGIAEGLGEEDQTSMLKLVERMAGITLREDNSL